MAAHSFLKAHGHARWTLADIPVECEEAYVLMGGSLLCEEVGTPGVDPNAMWLRGLRMVQAHVHIGISGVSQPENF